MSNDDHSHDDEDQIHRVDTVPPPDGEGDAYSAATKVGPMAEAVVKEMMHAAGVKAAELKARSDKKPETAGGGARAASDSAKPAPPSAPPRPSAPRPPAPQVRVDPRVEVDDATDADASIPRTYADEEEDNAETMLSSLAKPPPLPHAPHAPHAPRAPMQTLPLGAPLARPVTAPVALTPPRSPSPRSAAASAPAVATPAPEPPPVAEPPYPAPPWERAATPAQHAPLFGPRSLVVLAVCGAIFVIGLIMFLIAR